MNQNNPTTHSAYNSGFYDGISSSSSSSAARMLPVMFSLLKPDSIVDFGCGAGSWLAAAGRLGVRGLTGVEGPWQSHAKLEDPSIDLITCNMETDFPALPGRYDLAISLEVAEHLDPSRAEGFVDLITSSSDVAMFSAAIPRQLGMRHLNERWPSYWAGLFSARGWRAYDVIRPALWNDSAIAWYYRQNTFVYANSSGAAKLNREKFQELQTPIFDMVHPDLYSARTSIKGALVCLKHAMLAKVRGKRW